MKTSFKEKLLRNRFVSFLLLFTAFLCSKEEEEDERWPLTPTKMNALMPGIFIPHLFKLGQSLSYVGLVLIGIATQILSRYAGNILVPTIVFLVGIGTYTAGALWMLKASDDPNIHASIV